MVEDKFSDWATTVYRSFPGGVYHNLHTIFETLEQIGIQVPKQNRIYPYYACCDFEAYLCRDQLPENGPKLMFEARHVSMSVWNCIERPRI